MSEIISVNESEIKLMSDDALQFFSDEIRHRNTVIVNKADGTKLEINTQRDWNDFLTQCGAVKLPEKKKYRI